MREHLPPIIHEAATAGRRVAVLRFEAPAHQLSDVLAAIDDVTLWPFAPDVPPPTRSAVTRAKEVVLAVGPLAPGGPAKAVIGPSIKGGVVVTFPLPGKRDVTVASLNNQTSMVVLGKGWTGELQVEHISHADAVTQAREICRDAAPPESSPPDDR